MALLRPAIFLTLFVLSRFNQGEASPNHGEQGRISHGNPQQTPNGAQQQMSGMPGGPQVQPPGMPRMSGFQASFNGNTEIKQRFVRSPDEEEEIEISIDGDEEPPRVHRGPPHHHGHHPHPPPPHPRQNGDEMDQLGNERNGDI